MIEPCGAEVALVYRDSPRVPAFIWSDNMRLNRPRFWIVQAAVLAMLVACGDTGEGDGHGNDATGDDTVPDDVTPDDTPSPSGLAGSSGLGVSNCETADPSRTEADAEELFDYDHVPTFDLYLPEAAWTALQENAQDEQYVEAQACFDGSLIGTVGLRFKGYYGTLYGCFDEQGEMICPRLSMKLKFDEYDEEQRFYGLKRLNFNSYRYDDSRMKEKLAYDLFRSMGIVAPRSSWAVVRVNGESLGLYGMVEQVDGRFTADRWPDAPDGNLYKEAWPTETNVATLTAALKTNEEAADVRNFVAFSEAITSASEDDVLSTLARFMDVDYLARFLAVEDAVASYDGVTYFWTDGVYRNNHNYYIYEEASERFTLIPWDVESTFWINPDHAAPHWTEVPEDCSMTYEYWDGRASAPACDPIFRALTTDLSGWRSAARELLEGPFSLETMLDNIDRHQEFIGEAAHADTTPNMYGSFDEAVDNLRNVTPDLQARLENLIAE